MDNEFLLTTARNARNRLMRRVEQLAPISTQILSDEDFQEVLDNLDIDNPNFDLGIDVGKEHLKGSHIISQHVVGNMPR